MSKVSTKSDSTASPMKKNRTPLPYLSLPQKTKKKKERDTECILPFMVPIFVGTLEVILYISKSDFIGEEIKI